ncbi:MAG: hypothetical protein K6A64_06660, partial [Bacteroidales bacterium]|nr:hypothetical protein [Bacteroidales bacterium]
WRVGMSVPNSMALTGCKSGCGDFPEPGGGQCKSPAHEDDGNAGKDSQDLVRDLRIMQAEKTQKCPSNRQNQ